MHSATTTEPIFPVLCLSQDGSIAVADSAERLRRCNALAFFKNGYYDDLVVIDSRTNRFRVARVRVVPALSTVGRWFARVLNRRLQVELQLEATGSGSLDDAKQIVTEWLAREPDLWEASRDLDEWRAMVARAGTASALIALFA
jgi:hypothetical protein